MALVANLESTSALINKLSSLKVEATVISEETASVEKEISKEQTHKVLITVTKKNINLAVARNLIKRRMREGFRKNKLKLYSILENNSQQIHVAILYNSKLVLDYDEMEKKIILSLSKLAGKV